MNRQIALFTILLITILTSSLTSVLLAVFFQYPSTLSEPPSPDEFDTDFWDLSDVAVDPLQIDNISNRTSTYLDTSIIEWRFSYYSEKYYGIDIRINSIIIRPSNTSSSLPCLLFLHGYHGQYTDYLEIMRTIAASGIVVMGTDAPGSGDSTGPALNPFTFFNVSDGPESAHLYHSVWAAARAVTFIETLPYVASDFTIVGGVSMGSIETMILSAIDDRVDGSIPMIAAGNFRNSILMGSVLNTVIVPEYDIGSEEMEQIVKWFDPLPYARQLTEPVLFMCGTDDQYFPFASFRDTIQAISAPITLRIQPSWNHLVTDLWTSTIVEWLTNTFLEFEPFPSLDVSFTQNITFNGVVLDVKVSTTTDAPLSLWWRSSVPGSIWVRQNMTKTSYGYQSLILPVELGRVFFFVSADDTNNILYTSSMISGLAGSMIIPVALLLSFGGLSIIIAIGTWRPTKKRVIREIPIHVGLFMIIGGFVLPFFDISGRTQVSMLTFIEQYGNIFGMDGWFIPSIVIAISFIYALSAFRHQLPLRLTVLIWIPLMLVFVVLLTLFYGYFSIFSANLIIDIGIGTYLLLFSLPAMLLMERLFRMYDIATPNNLERKSDE
ncbi:MAG: conserved membrane protein of unknown function [Candidatus Thorarchaeota archaeon]|nr:MAG: conserved membrane protein of unknown function [Candidatus Thorarchaeota archaeon]